MSIIGINANEGQYPSTLYLYFGYIFYLTCGSSHLYGDGLSLKLLNWHSKLIKDCILWPKAFLKRWFGPRVAWLVLRIDLACTLSHPKAVPCTLRYRHYLSTVS
jgi:hypothetical protein